VIYAGGEFPWGEYEDDGFTFLDDGDPVSDTGEDEDAPADDEETSEHAEADSLNRQSREESQVDDYLRQLKRW
jgi:hypothetical protein